MFMSAVATSMAQPAATKSKFFVSQMAGLRWAKDGSGTPYLLCSIPKTAPETMYVLVEFPNPLKKNSPYQFKKTVQKKSGKLDMDGKPTKGWKNKASYTFLIHVYGDSEYKKKLGTHKQKVLCIVPPKELLDQLKNKRP